MPVPSRQLLLAIAVLAVIPFSASAQSDPKAETSPNAALSSLGASLSAPELPASQPATPERLQLMHTYLAGAQVDLAMKAFGQLRYSNLQSQVAASVAALPVNQQTLVMKAFRSAFDAAEARREATALDGMERYYATRLTDDELRTVVDFYAHGVGYKSLHDAQHMTPEDRQVAGQFVVSHPAMIKFTKLNFDYMKGTSTRQQTLGQAFNDDLKGQFCHNLEASHLKMSTCSGVRQNALRPG